MIQVETDARGVATITLARPEKRNALDRATIDALTEAARTIGSDDGVRVVVLTGEGAAFCAGGDLSWMREQIEATPEERAEGARALAGMLGALDAMPKPLIGRVNGDALGGGVGMACVCDVAVAATDARFGLTEVRLGLIPATIGPYVVARLGPAVRRIFMSGRVFGAEEAARLGIVARVAADLDAAVEEEVSPYLAAAPGAVASAKALARRLAGAPDAKTVEASIAALVDRWETGEARDGIAAFFDKRRPPWG